MKLLRVLSIENIAVAKEVELELEKGFSVLTGETGAGKSILLDGLSLVLGERITKDMIRPGEDRACVRAIFTVEDGDINYLSEQGLEPDAEGEIEIVRTFTADGKSTSKINSRNVSVTTLKKLSEKLISINSQSESHAADDTAVHRELLDAYSGTEELLAGYGRQYGEYQDAERELDELKESLRDKAMMIDILSYQLKEIDSAKLSDPDEEEKLEKLRVKLKDIEKVAKYAGIVSRALSENEKGATASYLLERAQSALEQLSGVMDNADALAARLESIRYEIIDIAEQAEELIGEDMENPDKKLDQVEHRLSVISKLKKKYGADIADILKFREDAAAKLDALESGDLAVKEAEAKAEKARLAAEKIASLISDLRKKNAVLLSKTVSETLKYLDMPKALFDIKVVPKENGNKKVLTPYGYDDISFMFTANPGYPMKELSKIASGGELSRTMLALKCALSDKSGVKTVVFDEIDTGVSGATSEKIGLKLKELSESVQVICVTHSPQVASVADHHFLIRKTEIDGKAQSSVSLLGEDERVSEIARIIGGVKITDKQLQAAREMIQKNK